MAFLNFGSRTDSKASSPDLDPEGMAFIDNWSIEVMPRTAAKVESFRALLPSGTRVYIAHIAGTPFEDMLATARRLTEEGFPVMPHLPARIIPDVVTLETWVRRYREEAGVTQALLLGGGLTQPEGTLESAIQLLETGLFDRYGFQHLHVAGHPRDIGRDGASREPPMEAGCGWHDGASLIAISPPPIHGSRIFPARTDAQMAIVDPIRLRMARPQSHHGLSASANGSASASPSMLAT